MSGEQYDGYLTFEKVRDADLARCHETWPEELTGWSSMEWACAMAGKAGEACNSIKKLRQLETKGRRYGPCDKHVDCGDKTCENRPRESDEAYQARLAGLRLDIGRELADTFLYLDLLAARLGLSLGAMVRRKFNETSEKVGSRVRL